MKLMSGNANKGLAIAIADYLDAPLSDVEIETFADGELFVRIDENMRGEDVFLIQTVEDNHIINPVEEFWREGTL